MNKETRIKRIQEIIERDKNNPLGNMEILWDGVLVPKNVFKIPLDFLVYNKYNGRILSRTQSLERQQYKIDAETPEGDKKIDELLWESNVLRNKTTLTSIEDYGQQKVGIITKDGIIIDGNRRVMLLRRSEKKKYNYFKTVVLDVTLEENPLEIEKLETTYQMGEDEKVGYNATEKYIKSKLLYRKLTSRNYIRDAKLNTKEQKDHKDAIIKIATWMGEDETEIFKYLNTMQVMDEYLNYLEYDGIYTQLDKREDQFLNLTKWLNNFYYDKTGNESQKAFDGYKNDDVDDLKTIAFDYIRTKYEGKEFRILAEGTRGKHFFGDKEIWKSFSKYHFEMVKRIEESEIDINNLKLKEHLDDRDNKYFEKTLLDPDDKESSFLKENISNHQTRLGYNEAAAKPQKLVSKASEAINAIKINHPAFVEPDVQKQLTDLGQKIFTIQSKKSPSHGLDQIINILEHFDLKKIPKEEIEDVRAKANKINQLSYRIKKDL